VVSFNLTSSIPPPVGVSANHVHGFGRLILQNVGRPSVKYTERLWVSSPRADGPGQPWITTVGHSCRPYDCDLQIIRPVYWLLEPVRTMWPLPWYRHGRDFFVQQPCRSPLYSLCRPTLRRRLDARRPALRPLASQDIQPRVLPTLGSRKRIRP
jgi:hypothetical protein